MSLSALGELAVVELDDAIAALRRIWSDANTESAAKGSGARVPPQVPLRAAFTPEILKAWLPNIAIIETVTADSGAPRFRARLVGTAVVGLSGYDPTGRFLDEIVAVGFYPVTVAPYLKALATGLPAEDDVMPDQIEGVDGARLPVRRLIMPCSSDGQSIDRFVVGLFLYRPEST